MTEKKEFNTWHDFFLQLLKKDFSRNKINNVLFSNRQQAKKLGLSIGTLSELLSGKRYLTERRVRKLLEKMQLTQAERRTLLALMGDDVEIPRMEVTPENYDIFTDWRVQAIAGLFELDEVDHTPAAVARRLRLPLKFVNDKISDLIKRGILKTKADGAIYRPREDWFGQLPPEVLAETNSSKYSIAILQWLMKLLKTSCSACRCRYFHTISIMNRLIIEDSSARLIV